ncbi:VWA domain-containing protein [Roseovarius mucosus]|uniref:VWA domain containing CoxE-like protein n=1 Tax=Roseovarius mucosus TaxID=215743 RepID=A0A1V0RLJ9_9RHOB|nr:VWA domain-containing protein [Roseovarius mucosus]ARE82472.1 VWA domain containing CoxE-like protein [Roseovarius mucosus]MBW4972795.1 VWA domain-containing protein [Roseovarius mucosus]
MSRVTRFAARDPGPSARIAGFIAHLRANGLRLGVGATQTALTALSHINAANPDETRRALKSVCASTADEVAQFDALFDSYWLNAGRVREKFAPSERSGNAHSRNSRDASGDNSTARGQIHAPDDGRGAAHGDGTGTLIASRTASLMHHDMRKLVSPQDIAEAESIARRLAQSLAYRRSRRRRAAHRGDQIHFRRLIRASLATGGEPLTLPRKKRPDRQMRIVALCDVSGSMTIYARVFLAFLTGLVRADDATDAWLFHTRLVRISDALRDPDPLRALNRLSLLADGFGGGSKIGASLADFARGPARHGVNSRTVVVILSDGYDTDAPAALTEALIRLRKRGGRIIWLNPLKGWADYAPVTAAMAAALPHLDLFAAATTLNDLAALGPQLERLT